MTTSFAYSSQSIPNFETVCSWFLRSRFGERACASKKIPKRPVGAA